MNISLLVKAIPIGKSGKLEYIHSLNHITNSHNVNMGI
jgi:hypothetical protein